MASFVMQCTCLESKRSQFCAGSCCVVLLSRVQWCIRACQRHACCQGLRGQRALGCTGRCIRLIELIQQVLQHAIVIVLSLLLDCTEQVREWVKMTLTQCGVCQSTHQQPHGVSSQCLHATAGAGKADGGSAGCLGSSCEPVCWPILDTFYSDEQVQQAIVFQ